MAPDTIDNTVHFKRLVNMLAAQKGHSLYADGNSVMAVNKDNDVNKLCEEPSGDEQKLWALALKTIIEKSLFM